MHAEWVQCVSAPHQVVEGPESHFRADPLSHCNEGQSQDSKGLVAANLSQGAWLRLRRLLLLVFVLPSGRGRGLIWGLSLLVCKVLTACVQQSLHPQHITSPCTQTAHSTSPVPAHKQHTT